MISAVIELSCEALRWFSHDDSSHIIPNEVDP